MRTWYENTLVRGGVLLLAQKLLVMSGFAYFRRALEVYTPYMTVYAVYDYIYAVYDEEFAEWIRILQTCSRGICVCERE